MISLHSSVSTSFMLAALPVLHVDTSHAPARRQPIEEMPLMAYQLAPSEPRQVLSNGLRQRCSASARAHLASGLAVCARRLGPFGIDAPREATSAGEPAKRAVISQRATESRITPRRSRPRGAR